MKERRGQKVQVQNESLSKDSLYQVEDVHENPQASIRNKTRRISDTKKQKLIMMVTKQNYRIKEAGALLGISYSTSKKIFTNFRIELRKKNLSEEPEEHQYKICRYCELCELMGERKNKNVEVVSSVAGELQSVEIKSLDFDLL